jgi:hypothetical protein
MADVNKLIKIINERAVQAPQNPMTGKDSLNVNLGLVHNYAEMLGKKIMSRKPEEAMKEMDMEAEDENYLSDSKKHLAAMELRDKMLQAKRDNKPLSSYALDPISAALFKGFIEKASNEAIANKKYTEYQKIGEGLNKK